MADRTSTSRRADEPARTVSPKSTFNRARTSAATVRTSQEGIETFLGRRHAQRETARPAGDGPPSGVRNAKRDTARPAGDGWPSGRRHAGRQMARQAGDGAPIGRPQAQRESAGPAGDGRPSGRRSATRITESPAGDCRSSGRRSAMRRTKRTERAQRPEWRACAQGPAIVTAPRGWRSAQRMTQRQAGGRPCAQRVAQLPESGRAPRGGPSA